MSPRAWRNEGILPASAAAGTRSEVGDRGSHLQAFVRRSPSKRPWFPRLPLPLGVLRHARKICSGLALCVSLRFSRILGLIMRGSTMNGVDTLRTPSVLVHALWAWDTCTHGMWTTVRCGWHACHSTLSRGCSPSPRSLGIPQHAVFQIVPSRSAAR
jgi:hypothetical protein